MILSTIFFLVCRKSLRTFADSCMEQVKLMEMTYEINGIFIDLSSDSLDLHFGLFWVIRSYSVCHLNLDVYFSFLDILD